MGMTDDKIREVLTKYSMVIGELEAAAASSLDALRVESASFYADADRLERVQKQLSRMRVMIPKMLGFLLDGRREKVFRWLGFLQGAFWVLGTYTIEQLADHNRPDPPGPVEPDITPDGRYMERDVPVAAARCGDHSDA